MVRACSGLGWTGFKSADELLVPFARIHHRAEHPNHIKDPCDAPLVERKDGKAAADEIGGDVGLEIGERQDEVRLQREDLVDIRRSECAYAWLLAASLRRAAHQGGGSHDSGFF